MGRVFQPLYTKRFPGGVLKKVKTKAWYVEWQRGGKTARRKIGHKAAANAALARFEDAEARRRAGVPDPLADAATRNRPLAELVAEYVQLLAAQDTSPDHRANVDARLTRTLAECRWHVLGDVDPDAFLRFLGRLRDEPRARKVVGAARASGGAGATWTPKKGLGLATLNGYMRTAKAFTRWAAEKVGAAGPLRKLKPYPEEVDRRRSRHILPDAELTKLLAATAAAKRKSGAAVWGADRAMLYRLAAYSGLRAGELSDLTPEHFSLDAAPPVVTVTARDAKGKREEPIPLPDHLVKLLGPWLAGRDPKGKLFPGTWAKQRKQWQWLAADLKRAGIDGRNAQGLPLTFHSLKRRYVVRLITQAGAKLHEVRRMARHKDVRTTLNHYVDENMTELGALANRLAPA